MVRGKVPRQPSKFGRQAGVPSTRRLRAGVEAGGKTGVKTRVKIAASKSVPIRPMKSKASLAKKAKGSALPRPKAAKPAPSKSSRPAGYDPLAPERVQEILRRLDATYPNVRCALHHKSAWELLVATILSAQCTDARVNMVTPELFRRYPTVRDFAALSPEQLEPEIRSTGFFRNKAKSIVGAARKIESELGGKVPDEMDSLLTLPGVARKTANVVLGSWFGKAEGVVVDTHVHRISRRLELTTNDEPQKIEQDLMRLIPRQRWIDFAHQLIHHGRALCLARTPKCANCPLENLCHAADKTWSTVELHQNAQ